MMKSFGALTCVLAIALAGCSGSTATVGDADAGPDTGTSPGTGGNGGDTDPDDGTPDGPRPVNPPDDAGGPPIETPACGNANYLPIPDDPGEKGPWPVGAKTVTIDGLTTEIWYPAKPGSEQGRAKVDYDIRLQLPDSEQKKIPDSENPLQNCDCYRDLPIDDEHGPYPTVIFVHGTASFRTQSMTQNVHWASRGFIVLSADHPRIRLKDLLASGFGGGGGGANQPGDVNKILTALQSPSGELAFLAGRFDLQRLGMSGHSAGGNAISGFGNRARVLMPLAASGTRPGPVLVSTLVMGGADDQIVRYSGQQSGYNSAPRRKRLVGIANAGHLAFSDLCFIGRDRGGILAIAQRYGVQNAGLVARLASDGCREGQLSAEEGWKVINYATSAALEETLMCKPSATEKLARIRQQFSSVSEYREAL
jgi:hypothetical protein